MWWPTAGGAAGISVPTHSSPSLMALALMSAHVSTLHFCPLPRPGCANVSVATSFA